MSVSQRTAKCTVREKKASGQRLGSGGANPRHGMAADLDANRTGTANMTDCSERRLWLTPEQCASSSSKSSVR